jgi:hypothetical protein
MKPAGFFEFEDHQQSTAIYPNRKKDKKKVEAKLNLREFGRPTTAFYTPSGVLFAVGYNRVVYGDHGPYVEFDRAQIKAELRARYKKSVQPEHYYEWLTPYTDKAMKVYDQKRTVQHMKNPPKGGFRGNRAEGYADYKIGKVYVSPYDFGKIEL